MIVFIHGFNVWQENPMCYGKHPKTKVFQQGCNAIDAASECNVMKFNSRNASVYGASGTCANPCHDTYIIVD